MHAETLRVHQQGLARLVALKSRRASLYNYTVIVSHLGKEIKKYSEVWATSALEAINASVNGDLINSRGEPNGNTATAIAVTE